MSTLALFNFKQVFIMKQKSLLKQKKLIGLLVAILINFSFWQLNHSLK